MMVTSSFRHCRMSECSEGFVASTMPLGRQADILLIVLIHQSTLGIVTAEDL